MERREESRDILILMEVEDLVLLTTELNSEWSIPPGGRYRTYFQFISAVLSRSVKGFHMVQLTLLAACTQAFQSWSLSVGMVWVGESGETKEILIA
jgi:hypothetical protein